MTNRSALEAGNLLALHYEQGGEPEDEMARGLLFLFGKAILEETPEIQVIAAKYGVTFEEICMICESAWSLMPNPCLRWRKLNERSSDANARMIASWALFEPEIFERIAIAISKHGPDDPMSGMKRVLALVDVSERELRSVAEDYIRRYGQPDFNLQNNGGLKAPRGGCLSLFLLSGCLYLALEAVFHLTS